MAKVINIDSASVRLPSARDRITIVGSTGSGKTQAGIWHLSNSNFVTRPWIIVDYKLEDSIAEIEADELDIGEVPKHPGIYVVHPLPSDEIAMDEFFMDIWKRENIGVYVDEGYMCGDGAGFVACLTQGRSKHIPMIVLSQRPVSISRFCFSEANFFQVFSLTDKRDKQTVRNFAPIPEFYRGEALPDYWSFYFDVSKRKLAAFKPVPPLDSTLEKIQAKLELRKPTRRYM